MKSEDFNILMQSIREDYYKGIIQETEARRTLESIMRDFGMLDADEFLVSLPENFRSLTGWMGPFRVRQRDSAYTWSRSYGLPDMQSGCVAKPQTCGDVEIDYIRSLFPQVTPLTEKDVQFFASYEKQMEDIDGILG